MWELSARKIKALSVAWQDQSGAPVFTEKGIYISRQWTEWTQGFQFGSALLQFDATSEHEFFLYGRDKTIQNMARHITNRAVHDHGFNIVSTYGTLLRLAREERGPDNSSRRVLYELALQCSGVVQAGRWTRLNDGGGFIYSFNGPHSLFADTIRSLRSLALAYRLGQTLTEEQDRKVNLLKRLLQHAGATAQYNVYYGRNRDIYDVPGRVAHESIFHHPQGTYRCPSTQQGYSPFSTWTRGLAWIMTGYAEQLEFVEQCRDDELEPYGGRGEIETMLLSAAQASCDFYLKNTPTDGIPYWDTHAPGLALMENYLDRPANPFNDYEPVDSSAAAIAAQGLLRLGHYLIGKKNNGDGNRYFQAGLTVLRTLLNEPYLSDDASHQGLILHSVYHRPNGWDYIPAGAKIPYGESTMWGDYHMREAALIVQRIAENKKYYTFFG